jgi:AcrR family transcriptional regulator
MATPGSETRGRILCAALKLFAERGYAGTSVQGVVDAARVTKPTLYYHFGSKAGLYQALVDWAHDERYRLMLEASGRAPDLAGRLVEIWAALFEFIRGHRELVRLAFATAFAAPGELPAGIRYLEKGRRNFELVHALIRDGVASGELAAEPGARPMALALWGMMTLRVMEQLVDSRSRRSPRLTREDAEQIVRLFLDGAALRGGVRRRAPGKRAS